MLNQSFIRATEKKLTQVRTIEVPSVDVSSGAVQEAIDNFSPPVTSITGAHTTGSLTFPITCSTDTIATLHIGGLGTQIYTPDIHHKHVQVDAFLATLFPHFGISSANHWVFLEVEAAPNTDWNVAIAIPSQGLYFDADPFTPQTIALTESQHNNYKAVGTAKNDLTARNATAQGYIDTFKSRYQPPQAFRDRTSISISQTPSDIITSVFTYTAEDWTDTLTPPFTLNAQGKKVLAVKGLFGFRATVYFVSVYVYKAYCNFKLIDANGVTVHSAFTQWKSLSLGTKHHMLTFQFPILYYMVSPTTPIRWQVDVDYQIRNMGSSFAEDFGPPRILVQFHLLPQIMISRPLVVATVVGSEVADVIPESDDLPVDGTITPADPTPVPTLTNWEFPSDMATLMSYLGNVAMTDADCLVALPNGYQLEVSSYADTRGAKNLFNLTTTAWRNAGASTPIYTKSRLPQLQYTQHAYTGAAPAVYQGGGNILNFFGQTLLEEDITIRGEYFGVTLPFDCTLKAVKIMPVTSLFAQCVRELCVLGSNNGGTTWSYVTDLLFEGYVTDTFTTVPVLSNKRFRMFRAVITQLNGSATYTTIQRAAFVFDTWDITPPTPMVPFTESIQFPDAYPSLVTYLQSVNLNDSVLTSVSGDYEMETSSYNPSYPLSDVFDQLVTQFRCAAPGTATNYRKGVAWSNAYTLQPYLNGVYQGGGHASNTYTSATATTTYAGEWIQFTVPFASELKIMHVQALHTNHANGPRNYVILAKNAGDAVWTLLADITHTSYDAGVFKNTTIQATGSSFTIYRMVILTLIDPVTIYLLRNIKYTFVAYSTPPTPVFV